MRATDSAPPAAADWSQLEIDERVLAELSWEIREYGRASGQRKGDGAAPAVGLQLYPRQARGLSGVGKEAKAGHTIAGSTLASWTFGDSTSLDEQVMRVNAPRGSSSHRRLCSCIGIDKRLCCCIGIASGCGARFCGVHAINQIRLHQS
ncbi:hypothetical protein Vretifemale_1509 [Volvox reticuliferus]|uniref:Uncharacterized protein n=1 Tax=Volvox reticuliferus TaxID=1737510 RepID=A0A8J4BY41_9CHLO|nr:hypothetical protein Vretifemale_1509 [Volvox reticuliferus]